MRDDLEMKKQYFRDSVYLKYENYKNKDIEMNIKLRKKNNKMVSINPKKSQKKERKCWAIC